MLIDRISNGQPVTTLRANLVSFMKQNGEMERTGVANSI